MNCKAILSGDAALRKLRHLSMRCDKATSVCYFILLQQGVMELMYKQLPLHRAQCLGCNFAAFRLRKRQISLEVSFAQQCCKVAIKKNKADYKIKTSPVRKYSSSHICLQFNLFAYLQHQQNCFSLKFLVNHPVCTNNSFACQRNISLNVMSLLGAFSLNIQFAYSIFSFNIQFD